MAAMHSGRAVLWLQCVLGSSGIPVHSGLLEGSVVATVHSESRGDIAAVHSGRAVL